ncbi:unnamed protein product [Protopolystoma xenopodis]|uniref:Uncharacterized protein n=1 Tax=Protopolystoma xenopodis TaxID=117903 RepID=A0A448X0G1_9PLAT|nr:unnamed protein product [Protopolystoma xenopodis]
MVPLTDDADYDVRDTFLNVSSHWSDTGLGTFHKIFLALRPWCENEVEPKQKFVTLNDESLINQWVDRHKFKDVMEICEKTGMMHGFKYLNGLLNNFKSPNISVNVRQIGIIHAPPLQLLMCCLFWTSKTRNRYLLVTISSRATVSLASNIASLQTDVFCAAASLLNRISFGINSSLDYQ